MIKVLASKIDYLETQNHRLSERLQHLQEEPAMKFNQSTNTFPIVTKLNLNQEHNIDFIRKVPSKDLGKLTRHLSIKEGLSSFVYQQEKQEKASLKLSKCLDFLRAKADKVEGSQISLGKKDHTLLTSLSCEDPLAAPESVILPIHLKRVKESNNQFCQLRNSVPLTLLNEGNTVVESVGVVEKVLERSPGIGLAAVEEFFSQFEKTRQVSDLNRFKDTFEKMFAEIFRIVPDDNGKRKTNRDLLNVLFGGEQIKTREFCLKRDSNNLIEQLSGSSLISMNCLIVLMILVGFNFYQHIEKPAEKIYSLIQLINQREGQLETVFAKRVLNALFKKFISEITIDDIKRKKNKISNSFGYVQMLFSELLFLFETEILFRPNADFNLQNSLRNTKKNSLFRDLCILQLKKERRDLSCRFFVDVHDLVTAMKLVTGLPCMVKLNHRFMDMVRKMLVNQKFWGSEQEVLSLVVVKNMSLPNNIF